MFKASNRNMFKFMSLLLTLNIFTSFSSVSIGSFEQVNAGWKELLSVLSFLNVLSDFAAVKF